MVGTICAARSCGNYKRGNLSFFRFPKDAKRCKIWLVNCGRDDLDKFYIIDPRYLYDNCRLCASHFEDNQFFDLRRNRLKPSAVPTLFNVSSLPPHLTTTCKTKQQHNHLSDTLNELGTVGTFSIDHDRLKPALHSSSTNPDNLRVVQSGSKIPAALSNNRQQDFKTTLFVSHSSSSTNITCKANGMMKNGNQAEITNDICRNVKSEVLGTLKLNSDVLKKDFSKHVTAKPFACTQDVNLQKHMHTHADEEAFPRTHCAREFDHSSYHLKRHLLTHTSEKSPANLTCTRCRKAFSNAVSLEEYIQFHNGEMPYTCKFCGSKFLSLGGLGNHLKTFHRIMMEANEGSCASYDCSPVVTLDLQCEDLSGHDTESSSFGNLNAAPVEFKEELQEDGFGLASMNHREMTNESTVHSGNPESPETRLSQYLTMVATIVSLDHNYSCQLSGMNDSLQFQTADAYDLVNVIKTEPPDDIAIDTPTHETLCVETSESNLQTVTSSLTDVFKVSSGKDMPGEKSYPQTRYQLRVSLHGKKHECLSSQNHKDRGRKSGRKLKKSTSTKVPQLSTPRKIANTNIVKKILLKHSVKKSFPCTHCKKRFKKIGALKTHLRIHAGEKPFPCTQCEKRYTRLDSLQVHLRIHTGERPFPCTHCRMEFQRSDNLKRHLLTHKSEKPPANFACTRCGMVFAYPVSLKEHIIQIHNGEMPYTCTYCGSKFTWPGSLRNHVAIVHGIKMENINGSCPSQDCNPDVNSNLLCEEDLSELGARSSSFASVECKEEVQDDMDFRESLTKDSGQGLNPSLVGNVEIKVEPSDFADLDQNESNGIAPSPMDRLISILNEPDSGDGDLIHVIKPEFDEMSGEETDDCENHGNIEPSVVVFPVTFTDLTPVFQLFY